MVTSSVLTSWPFTEDFKAKLALSFGSIPDDSPEEQETRAALQACIRDGEQQLGDVFGVAEVDIEERLIQWCSAFRAAYVCCLF